jgi:hypothetical protein
VLYCGPELPQSLVLDSTTVFFTTYDNPLDCNGEIYRVEEDGTGLMLLLNGQCAPDAIQVDSQNAYWRTSFAGNGDIQRVFKGGGPQNVVFNTMAYVGGIAVGGSKIYWSSPTGIWSMVLGGTPSNIVPESGDPGVMTADGTGIHWVNEGSFGGNDGAIKGADLGGASPATLTSGESYTWAIATDASNVYWATDNGVRTIGKDGQGYLINVSSGPVHGIAVDATDIYYTLGTDVLKVPIGSTSSTLVAAASASTQDVAVGATDVYYSTVDFLGMGTLIKVAK